MASPIGRRRSNGSGGNGVATGGGFEACWDAIRNRPPIWYKEAWIRISVSLSDACAATKPPGRRWCACTPAGSTGCATASPGSDSEAQDLTQEVFLRVFRSLKSFRGTEGSLATWLARLTRNLLIDHYRRTRQERVTDSIEEQLPVLEEAVPASARPDGMVAGREASEILQAALQKLSPELRETVILRDLQGMEYREIRRC